MHPSLKEFLLRFDERSLFFVSGRSITRGDTGQDVYWAKACAACIDGSRSNQRDRERQLFLAQWRIDSRLHQGQEKGKEAG